MTNSSKNPEKNERVGLPCAACSGNRGSDKSVAQSELSPVFYLTSYLITVHISKAQSREHGSVGI